MWYHLPRMKPQTRQIQHGEEAVQSQVGRGVPPSRVGRRSGSPRTARPTCRGELSGGANPPGEPQRERTNLKGKGFAE